MTEATEKRLQKIEHWARTWTDFMETPKSSVVVELEMADGSVRYAIQHPDGTYYGQRWDEDRRVKSYRTWKTKRAAERKLKAVGLTLEKVSG